MLCYTVSLVSLLKSTFTCETLRFVCVYIYTFQFLLCYACKYSLNVLSKAKNANTRIKSRKTFIVLFAQNPRTTTLILFHLFFFSRRVFVFVALLMQKQQNKNKNLSRFNVVHNNKTDYIILRCLNFLLSSDKLVTNVVCKYDDTLIRSKHTHTRRHHTFIYIIIMNLYANPTMQTYRTSNDPHALFVSIYSYFFLPLFIAALCSVLYIYHSFQLTGFLLLTSICFFMVETRSFIQHSTNISYSVCRTLPNSLPNEIEITISLHVIFA